MRDRILSGSGPVGIAAEHFLESAGQYAARPDVSLHLNHLIFGVELPPGLSAAHAIKGVRILADSVPALRAAFVRSDDGWAYDIPAKSEADIQTVEIDDGVVWEVACSEYIAAQNHVPMELLKGTPFQARILTKGDSVAVVFKVHHALCDGYSVIVLRTMFREILTCLRGGRAYTKRQPAEDFLGVFRREQDHAASESFRENLAWYRGLLADHPQVVSDLTTRRDGWLRTMSLEISPAMAKKLAKRSETSGVKVPAMLFGTFADALQQATGSDDLLVLFQKGNRSVRTRQTIADLTDLLTVRYAPGPASDLDARAREAQTAISRAKAHWEPYWRLVRAIAPERFCSPMGFSPYLFNFISANDAPVRQGAGGLKPVPTGPLETRCTLFDILCNVLSLKQDDTSDPTITINLRYNDAEVTAERARRLHEAFVGRLELLADG